MSTATQEDPKSGSTPDAAAAAPPVHRGKRWRVGTLVYTAGGLVALFCWLLWGDLAWSMKDRTVSEVFKVVLTKFTSSATLFSVLIVAMPPAVGILIGPVVSYKSDRFRSRWGRRIPFILATTPIAAVSMILLGAAPAVGHGMHVWLGSRSPGENAMVVVVLALLWTAFDVANTLASAVVGALINDVVPREVIGRFYGLFRAISLIVGIVLNWYVLGYSSTHYHWIFLGVGLVYGVGVVLMCLNIKEGDYPPPPTVAEKPSRMASTRDYFRTTFAKPYYYWVFAAVIIPGLAFLPIYTFNLPYAKSLGMSDDAYFKLTAVFFCISLAQAYPLGWLADKFHPLRVAMVTLALHAVVALAAGLLIHDRTTFSVAMIVTGTLQGSWGTATASLTALLFPRQKFAQFASALGILVSFLMVLAGIGVGPALDWAGRPYHCTYLAAFVLDIVGLVATFVLFRKFLALGGAKHYVAPE